MKRRPIPSIYLVPFVNTGYLGIIYQKGKVAMYVLTPGIGPLLMTISLFAINKMWGVARQEHKHCQYEQCCLIHYLVYF